MILGKDGARLSKRHGAVNVLAYRDEGFFPEALLNYLVRLGWSHGDQEIFSMQAMQELFSLEAVNRAPSTFNPEKLAWINQEYLKDKDVNTLSNILRSEYDYEKLDGEGYPALDNVVALYQDRVGTVKELAETIEVFYQDIVRYDEKSQNKFWKENTPNIVTAVKDQLETLEEWSVENLSMIIKDIVKTYEVGFAKVAQPLRIALLGSTNAPSIDALLEVCGKDLTLKRIEMALTELS